MGFVIVCILIKKIKWSITLMHWFNYTLFHFDKWAMYWLRVSYKRAMSVCLRSCESDIIMVITIEQALYPLLLTLSVFGFGAYFLKKIYFSVFYGLTIWIFYVCLYYYVLVKFKLEYWLYDTFTAVSILMSIFVIIISIIMNIYHIKVYIHIFLNL